MNYATRPESSSKTPLRLGALAAALVTIVCCAAPPNGGRGAFVFETSDPNLPECALYDRHCAICHGADGSGNGPASAMLEPAPRDFGLGMFALVSTRNGVPTLGDLEASIRRGMPGSAMPSFGWMSGDEVTEVARHVRELALAGIARNLRAQADEIEQEMLPEEARHLAEKRMTPGEVVEFRADPNRDLKQLEPGRTLYYEHCAACHGVDGKGRRPVPEWDDTHRIWTVRDFTAGIMKGRTTPEELARRIVAGMPVSAMPPTQLADDELHALVGYVSSLIPPGADERLTQTRERIHARRIATAVPGTPGDAAWNSIPSTRVALAPFRWDDEAVVEAQVAAVHDGTQLALRITWADDTCDQRMIAGSNESDAVAVQWSNAQRPPLFGMGSKDHPVNIWHWKAFRFRDVAGMTDLLERQPHGWQGGLDVPLYQPAPGALKASETADSVQVGGHEQLPRSRDEFACSAAPQWSDGVWTVVLRRALAARSDGEIQLVPGQDVQVGFAVWDGSRGGGPTGKSITIWHELVLGD